MHPLLRPLLLLMLLMLLMLLLLPLLLLYLLLLWLFLLLFWLLFRSLWAITLSLLKYCDGWATHAGRARPFFKGVRLSLTSHVHIVSELKGILVLLSLLQQLLDITVESLQALPMLLKFSPFDVPLSSFPF
jgi:hypothetical protein